MILILAIFILHFAISDAFAQWSEPSFTPEIRTAALAADPPPVTGTTFYVDGASIGGTCNNSNAGTSTSAPWCTIQKAAQTLTAGQAALVRAGTYTENQQSFTNQGTAGNYITLRNYPGETPIMSCSDWCFGPSQRISYVVFDGITFQSANTTLIHTTNTSSNNIWIINSILDGANANNCIHLEGGGNFSVISNNLIRNCQKQSVVVNGISTRVHDVFVEFNEIKDGGFDGDDDGAIKCIQHYKCMIRYNHIYNHVRNDASSDACFDTTPPIICQGLSGIYFDFGQDSTFATRSYIYNNNVHDNDAGIQLYIADNVTIFNNITYQNGRDPDKTIGFSTGNYNFSFGRGISLRGEVGSGTGTVNGLEVYNNVSFGNKRTGIYLQEYTSDIILKNNIYMNNDEYEFNADNTSAGVSNFTADNDLFFDNNLGGTLMRWQGTDYATLAAFKARGGNTMYASGVEGNPNFVNTTSGSENFHVSAGSAALNVGATIGAFSFDYANVTRSVPWDIGVYEDAAGRNRAVVISSPLDGSIVPRKSSVSIEASWDAEPPEVTNVTYAVNGQSLNCGMLAMFCDWLVPNPPNRSYTLEVTVRGQDGGSGGDQVNVKSSNGKK